MPSDILPIKEVPAAFGPEADKINEIIKLINGLKNIRAKEPLDWSWGTSVSAGPSLMIDPQKFQAWLKQIGPNPITGGGDGGGGSFSIYTFTACVNGSPASFDIPIQAGPY